MRISDWSSDVCSSELARRVPGIPAGSNQPGGRDGDAPVALLDAADKLLRREMMHLGLDRDGRAERRASPDPSPERTSVGQGQRVSVRVDRGGRGILTKNTDNTD